jgi:hypothetical protein
MAIINDLRVEYVGGDYILEMLHEMYTRWQLLETPPAVPKLPAGDHLANHGITALVSFFFFSFVF